MSLGSASTPIDLDDDDVSVVSNGVFVYEDPWEAAASDDDEADAYTNNEGTVRVLERTIAKIPVLSASDSVTSRKNYGLRMIISARIGRVDDLFVSNKAVFKSTKHFRLPFPLRPTSVQGEEADILLNDGMSWDIDVLAPAYAPDASTEKSTPWMWNVEGCFHPNWVVWKRQVADNSFRVSAGQTRWSTAVAHLFIPVDGGLQKAGATVDKSLELPTNPVTVHGFGICDPNKYRWKDARGLPDWLDETERTKTMGFLRMSTRFNMRDIEQGAASKIPPSGDYPFHVLLYWPKSANFLRFTRHKGVINSKGPGFFRTDGRVIHFVGKLVGLLKTSLLRDVPLGVYIPVIIPSDVNIDGGTGSGAGGGQFDDLKPRTTPKKTAGGAGGRTSSEAGTASSPAATSPSAARASRGHNGGTSARKLQKGRLDALLGIELEASSGGPSAVGRTRGSTIAGVGDADAALQSSITEADPLGREDSPDQFYEALLPSRTQGTTAGGEGDAGDLIGDASGDDPAQPGTEPETRGQKRARAGKETVTKRSSGKRRTGAKR